MGYAIRTRPQITPAQIVAHGPYGDELRTNPGAPPIDPPGYRGIVYQPEGFNPYSDSPALRTELLDVDGGTANVEIFSIFPKIRAWKGEQIRQGAAKLLHEMVSPYSDSERESWPVQMAEAEAYTANPATADTPMLASLAEARGIQLTVLVDKVTGNVNLYRQGAGYVLGLQQALLDQIEAATDFNAMMAIKW